MGSTVGAFSPLNERLLSMTIVPLILTLFLDGNFLGGAVIAFAFHFFIVEGLGWMLSPGLKTALMGGTPGCGFCDTTDSHYHVTLVLIAMLYAVLGSVIWSAFQMPRFKFLSMLPGPGSIGRGATDMLRMRLTEVIWLFIFIAVMILSHLMHDLIITGVLLGGSELSAILFAVLSPIAIYGLALLIQMISGRRGKSFLHSMRIFNPKEKLSPEATNTRIRNTLLVLLFTHTAGNIFVAVFAAFYPPPATPGTNVDALFISLLVVGLLALIIFIIVGLAQARTRRRRRKAVADDQAGGDEEETTGVQRRFASGSGPLLKAGRRQVTIATVPTDR